MSPGGHVHRVDVQRVRARRRATSCSVSGVPITATVFVPGAWAVTAIYVIVRSRSPIGIRNVSPAVTAALEERSSRPRNVPPEEAVHSETQV